MENKIKNKMKRMSVIKADPGFTGTLDELIQGALVLPGLTRMTFLDDDYVTAELLYQKHLGPEQLERFRGKNTDRTVAAVMLYTQPYIATHGQLTFLVGREDLDKSLPELLTGNMMLLESSIEPLGRNTCLAMDGISPKQVGWQQTVTVSDLISSIRGQPADYGAVLEVSVGSYRRSGPVSSR